MRRLLAAAQLGGQPSHSLHSLVHTYTTLSHQCTGCPDQQPHQQPLRLALARPRQRRPSPAAAASSSNGNGADAPQPPPQQLSSSASMAAAAEAAAPMSNLADCPRTPWGATAWFCGAVVTSVQRQVAQLAGQWGRFLPMCLLFFLLAFNNTLLDSIKDSLVITAAGGGTEVIPFLTGGCDG